MRRLLQFLTRRVIFFTAKAVSMSSSQRSELHRFLMWPCLYWYPHRVCSDLLVLLSQHSVWVKAILEPECKHNKWLGFVLLHKRVQLLCTSSVAMPTHHCRSTSRRRFHHHAFPRLYSLLQRLLPARGVFQIFRSACRPENSFYHLHTWVHELLFTVKNALTYKQKHPFRSFILDGWIHSKLASKTWKKKSDLLKYHNCTDILGFRVHLLAWFSVGLYPPWSCVA